VALMMQFCDGLSCPTVVCDYCQRPIVDARDGGYFWPLAERQEGQMMSPVFLHKGRCDNAYSARHGRLDCWDELSMLPLSLADNLQIDRAQWTPPPPRRRRVR
jgi:hypothetical protein